MPPRPAEAGAQQDGGVQTERVNWRPIVIYVLLADALAWVLCLPLWLGRGLNEAPEVLIPVLLGMMVMPAVAAAVTLKLVERKPFWRTVGAVVPRPLPRWFAYLAIAVGGIFALVLGALLTSRLLGQYQWDLANLSGFREALEHQLRDRVKGGQVDLPPQTWLLALATIPNLLIASVINTIPAAGEEIGWRGFLFPRLQPLGTWPAIVVSGAIWGTWHAPVILLGYNYPSVPPWLGLVLMVVFCTLCGGFLAWLRVRSASVWPAALGHGTLNAAVGATAATFSLAGHPVNTANGTIMGWAGWIVPLIVVAVLVATGKFVPKGADAAKDAGISGPAVSSERP